MRNPTPRPEKASWMERALAKHRELLRRASSLAEELSSPRRLRSPALLCALLVGCVSLVALARERSAKNEGTPASAGTKATKAEATPTTPEKKHEATETDKPAAAKEKSEATAAAKEEKEAAEPAAPNPKPQGFQNFTAPTAKEPEDEQESPDLVRERGAWFHDQRAYPFEHIPSGALQKAIQQRELMRQQQREAFKAGAGAQAVISFPGDALWHLTGPQPVDVPFGFNGGSPTASGRVTAIAVDPTDATGNTVYIGGAAGGVWKTTDGGTTWTSLTDTQPSLAVGSITIDPNNHLTIYVGTGEENFNGDAYYGAGILKSTDGGAHWTQIGASTFAQVLGPQTGGALIGQIAVQPGNSNIVLAAVSFFVGGTVGGIYRSTDGGTTWAEDAAPQGVAATAVVFESTSNAGTTATAWAAMGNPFGEAANGIYKSTDSGATWTKQTSILPTTSLGRITLGYAPSTAGATATVYAAIADSSTSSSNLLGLFKTVNGGTAWTAVTGPAGGFCNGQCFYDMAIGVHPTNPSVVVIGGGAYTDNFTSLFESIDGGSTWTGTGANDFSGVQGSVHPHVDTHAIVFTPMGTTLKLYVANDGGMWSTTNPVQGTVPPTWVDLNATLAITQFYPGPSAGIGDENYGFGGTQDNDTEVFSGTLDWTNVLACGDGGFTAIDPKIPTTVYTSCDSKAGTVVKKSVFNGAVLPGPSQSFNAADTGIVRTDRSQFIAPLTLDQNSPTTLYFGTCRVFQTLDGATTWNAISGDLSLGNATVTTTCPGTGSITTMDVSHQSSSILLAGTSNGTVWESLTGGAIWTQIDGGFLPPRHVTAVRTKRNDATGQIAYVTFSGFGACAGCGATPGHVFKTTNGGTTWTNISGDLPDIPVNDLIVDHSSNPTFDALYIGTDVGVFSCPDPEAATPCQNWTVVGDGLPNSPVLGLAMRRSSRILRAFTHGRCAWHIQLTDENPPAVASLSSVTPGAVNVGAASTLVTFTGLNFSANTVILVDGVSIGTPTFVSTSQLTATVSSSLFTDGHVFQVTITDPAGADTGIQPFTVMNPVPFVSGFAATPDPGLTYASVALHFTGSGFVPSTTVTFNGIPLGGGVVSGGGTVFDVTIPALSNIAVGTFQVALFNPLPGGGPAGSAPLNIIQNPNALAIFSPSIIVLGPTALGVTSTPVTNVTITNPGAAALNITTQTIAGTGSTPTTNFSFAAPTTGTSCGFPSSGQSGTATPTVAANNGSCTFGMTFTPDVPTGLITRTGTLTVQDNGVGHPQVVQIIGLVPTPNTPLAILTPQPVNFGPVAIGTTSPTMIATLTSVGTAPVNVTSTGFTISVPGSDGADFHLLSASGTNPACPLPPTTFSLNPGQACDLGVSFSPTNPARIENATLNVADNVTTIPQTTGLTGSGVQITSISPEIVSTGGPAFTLTVNGGGYASSAVVNVNGSARLTTFVSATQLLASIPASDITTAGNLAITVTTPVPGGVPSEPKTLVVAQAPVATNDNINFATSANTPPFRITQDTTHATVNTGGVNDPTPPCAPGTATQGGKARSVWFTATPPVSGKVVFDTRFSNYPTILSGWQGMPGSLVTVPGACSSGNVPGTVPASEVVLNVTGGTQYYIMVSDASATGAGGTLTFSLDFASAAPANDAFANAINASPTPFTNTVNSIEATINTGGAADPTPTCAPVGAANGGIANSVWYKFTAPSAGTITADTLTSPYETILTAVTGTTGSFTQVACNASASAGVAQSLVSFAATSGTTYFFMVSSVLGDGGTTNFHLAFNPGGVGTASKLAFTTQPTNVAAGSSITPAVQVTVQDSSGNTVTTATNSVTLAIGTNPGSGTLSGTTTVAAVNGVATFSNLSINKVGTGYTLNATSAGLASATSSAFNVTPGVAAKLAFTVQPTNTAAGSAITPAVQVTVQDAQGNTVTTATNAISMAIGTNPGGGTLSGTTTVAAVAGIATFPTLSINKTGTGYTLGASATGLTGASSSAFNITPGAATKLAFTVQPTNVGAGATITPAVQVTVQDALGNTVTTATNSIAMAIGTNPGGGTLSGATPVAAVAGVATFSNLSINNAGVGYTLAASTAGLTSAASSAFNVTSGTASKLAFTVQPSNVVAGAAITPAVQVAVEDSLGNVITTATNTVTIAIGTNPSGGTLSGTTSVAAVNGIATFSNLSINNAGTGYTLGASATSLTSATSSAFNVTSGTATKLAFTVQPTNVAAGSAITPAVQVTVQDAQGNIVTTATTSITIAIGTNPGSGTLSGTTTVAAVAGVATFPTLSINKLGTATRWAQRHGSDERNKQCVQCDRRNRNKTCLHGSTHECGSRSGNHANRTSDGPGCAREYGYDRDEFHDHGYRHQPWRRNAVWDVDAAAVAGVATFSDLNINNAGIGYTLTASSTGLTIATSSAFNVTAGTAAKLAFTVQPSNVAAGAAITPSGTSDHRGCAGQLGHDFDSSMTMAIGTNPGGGTLSGTATVKAVAGVASFSSLEHQ